MLAVCEEGHSLLWAVLWGEPRRCVAESPQLLLRNE